MLCAGIALLLQQSVAACQCRPAPQHLAAALVATCWHNFRTFFSFAAAATVAPAALALTHTHLQAVRAMHHNSKKALLAAALHEEFSPAKLGITQQASSKVTRISCHS